MAVESGLYKMWGPPGTGKTTSIAAQARAEVMARGSEAVMICSLTKTAAKEVAGRNLPMHDRQIGTLHSHAYRSLGTSITVAEKKVDEWNDGPGKNAAFRLSGGSKVDVNEPEWEQGSGKEEGDQKYMEMQTLRARMVPTEQWPIRVRSFAKKWSQFKYDIDALDFTDMIDIALKDVHTAPGEPEVIIADECQDLSLLEISLVKKWGDAAHAIIMAGDPYQNLYSWRGADPAVFLADDVPPERMSVLDQSYRVPVAVHSKAMAWIKQHSDFVDFQYKPRAVQGRITRVEATWPHPAPLLRSIEKNIADGKTVMVLAACSYMLRPLLQELRGAAIPFQNAYRIKRGDWNPLRRGYGTSQRMSDYLRPHPAMWDDRARLWSPEEFENWIGLIKGKGTLRHGAKTAAKKALKESKVGEMTLGDILKYFEEDATKSLLYSIDSIPDALKWLSDNILSSKKRLIDFPIKLIQKHGPKILREDFPLTVGTIHSVKGGEADVVYVWPDLSGSGCEEWLSQGRDSVIRLFYVAMTRAKEQLVICEPSGDQSVPI